MVVKILVLYDFVCNYLEKVNLLHMQIRACFFKRMRRVLCFNTRIGVCFCVRLALSTDCLENIWFLNLGTLLSALY